MKILKKIIMTFAYALLVAAPITAVATPQQAAAGPACEQRILGIPPWYRGLTDDDCNITPPESDKLPRFIWTIVLNVVEIALFIAGFVALGFIIYGGFLFMTGGANPTQTENGRKAIINAAVGFAISTAAIGAVNLIFRIING